ncbi:DUF4232 domain-containing protein [Streptomyces brasiliensis]|uniref:Lipoprotein n=1 Tax=Streptomyces brasiliensis TaxID=1954 RepID=A0A917UJH6_9ACTN|nr:DUF4232 domain-containing protein [Streptomyces brasiliensis]GGJ61229.1 lipoprotein [Streptomyces brasiliensis]
MRRRPLSLGSTALVAGLLLLTACGQQPGPSSGRSYGPSCGGGHSSSSAAPGTPGGEETDGVRIVRAGDGPDRCAVFQVTNHHAEPFTYTITFGFRTATGTVPTYENRVVPSVEPGATVSGGIDTVDRQAGGAAERSRVEVVKVRSVPADEAPAPGGPCPSSGVRVYADDGDAAMGLRVVTLHLVNCGTGIYRIEGYPRLSVLDSSHKRVADLRILHDGSSIALSTGADGPPRPLALKPGERAHAGLVWRNTVLSGTPVNAPYVRVWAEQGAAPVMVTPELDLGTTGKLAVGPWKKES